MDLLEKQGSPRIRATIDSIDLKQKGVFFIMLITLLAFAYEPMESLGFAVIDDDWMLLGDSFSHPLKFDLDYCFKLFTSYSSVQYSPLNTLYYYAIYKINGFDPYWYHIFSFIVHIINVILIFLLVNKLLKLFKKTYAAAAALICCSVWAIHPLNVEAVVWISASKVPLYSMFSLICLLGMMNFLLSGLRKFYLASLLAFILGCFIKDQAVITPMMFPLLYLVPGLIPTGYKVRNWIILLAPYFIVSVFFGFLTIDAQQTAFGIGAPSSLYPFYDRFFLSFYCLSFYLTSWLIPLGLHYNYKFPMKPGEQISSLFYLIPVLLMPAVGYFFSLIVGKPNFKLYLFWILFFALNISLCIQILPMRRPAVMADRYMYLPLIGILVIVISTIFEAFEKIRHKNLKLLILSVGALYFLTLAFTTNHLVTTWSKYNLKLN